MSTRKEPGRGAGRASGAGTGPGSGLGFVPGTASGSGRDTDRAPGAGPGTDPGQGPGAGHGPGTAPGTDSGYGTGPAADGGLAQGSDRAHGQGQGGAAPEPLLDGTDRDRLGRRMHHALAGFVDSPHDAVAEAAEVLDEVEKQLIASLQDRRAALREGWQGKGASGEGGVDTERLRLTLRTYREVTERLLAT
ncbi:hypothetical protein [Streptomyces sp. NPDC008121]|uniref:hypothetical protein n=1 Tax=Streptomyces sp. NPDC008121 TaxID=3364809 RepID=UPI0036EF13A2